MIDTRMHIDVDDALMVTRVRPMSAMERRAWNTALRVSANLDRDDADDDLARRANNHEESSVSAEHRGMHRAAIDHWTVSELLDVARAALIR